MTSYTKKLYEISPSEAVKLHRQEMRDYRYGKHVTLATFAASTHGFGNDTFGKRKTPPLLPAYECWSPTFGRPRAIVRASDSFQARKEYALYHQIAVTDCCARPMLSEAERIQQTLERDAVRQNPPGWREVDGVALPPIDWADRS